MDAARYIIFSVIPSRLWEVLYHPEVKDPTLKTKNLPSWVFDWTLDKDSLPDPPWLYVDNYEIVDPSSEDSDNSRSWDDAVRRTVGSPHDQYPYHFHGFVGPLFIPFVEEILSFFYSNSCLDIVDELNIASFEQNSIKGENIKRETWNIVDKICRKRYSNEPIVEDQEYINFYQFIYSSWETLGVMEIFLSPISFSKDSTYGAKFINAVELTTRPSMKTSPTEKAGRNLSAAKDLYHNIGFETILPKDLTFARFQSGSIGLVSAATKKGYSMLRFDSLLAGTCGILRKSHGYEDSDFDSDIISRVTIDVEDVGSVFHCTFVGSGFVEHTETWRSRHEGGFGFVIIAIH
ncbi:hypothetical protein BCON_0040g00350 [Botryotinia convoluta]|uniref:Uncharacterized protein n=1 Tax=Botryotinia convoluta TaxID=54673 RepID=A0A4Z1IK64_9HELO|nr:hypothetical protein BCON_0040g00350 [Botryotinia convoluta]